MDVKQMVAQLHKVGWDIPPDLEATITQAGPDAVVELLRVIEDKNIWPEDGDEENWAPAHAASLLADIGASEAIEPLLAALRDSDWNGFFHGHLIDCLAAFGAQVVDPVLQLRQNTENAQLQNSLAWVLAKTQAKDERILPLLRSYLQCDPEFAAFCLVDYGDTRALPWLHEALDAHEVQEEDSPFANRAVIELEDAIKCLGGTLSTTQQSKYQAVCAAKRKQRKGRISSVHARSWPDPPSSEPWSHESAYVETAEQPRQRTCAKLGRNNLCWCSSGKKYKKCHEQSDRQSLYA